jgi:hypothetical protein
VLVFNTNIATYLQPTCKHEEKNTFKSNTKKMKEKWKNIMLDTIENLKDESRA